MEARVCVHQALTEYQVLANEGDAQRVYSDMRVYFNTKMCNLGKKFSGRSSPPATLARNQALYRKILERMKAVNTLDDESDSEVENDGGYDFNEELADEVNEETGYASNEEQDDFDYQNYDDDVQNNSFSSHSSGRDIGRKRGVSDDSDYDGAVGTTDPNALQAAVKNAKHHHTPRGGAAAMIKECASTLASAGR